MILRICYVQEKLQKGKIITQMGLITLSTDCCGFFWHDVLFESREDSRPGWRKGWGNVLVLHCWNCDSLAVIVVAHFDTRLAGRHLSGHKESFQLILLLLRRSPQSWKQKKQFWLHLPFFPFL